MRWRRGGGTLISFSYTSAATRSENSEYGPSPLQLRRTASQACSALRHLHAAGFVHMGLAAKNILVKWRQPGLTSGGASGSLYDIKISDLGSVMQADPRERSRIDAFLGAQRGEM